MLAYAPVWRAGYLWDDDVLLTGNPCIVGPLGLREIWTTRAADICPLTITGFWLEHRLWGLHPLPYHLVNVGLHAACACLLWRVLRTLQIPGAWLGAALWALHPVQAESVAWITEMKNTLSGVFFLLAILSFLRWQRTGETGRRHARAYVLTLLWAALAMASKSSTVVLPGVFLLLAWWQHGRWQRRTLAAVAPVAAFALAAATLAVWTQTLLPAEAADPRWTRSLPQRLAAAGDAFWFYLGKLSWPHGLSMIYPRWEIDASRWTAFLPLLAAFALLSVLWLARRTRARGALLACACFGLAVLPVLGLVEMTYSRHSLVADHFLYLASMAPLALAGAGIARLGQRFPRLPAVLGLAWLLALGLATWQRAGIYETPVSLWTDTLAKNPRSWIAHESLGGTLLQQGQPADAATHLRESLRLNPRDTNAAGDLALALLRQGEVDAAIATCESALAIDPHQAGTLTNLGLALAQKGQPAAAVRQFRAALQIDPRDLGARNDLGNALVQQGRLVEAEIEYRQALATTPDSALTHQNLGFLCLRAGRLPEATAEYRAAVDLDPANATFQNNLGIALAQANRINEAAACFQEAVRLDPANRDAQNNLARARAALGPPAGVNPP